MKALNLEADECMEYDDLDWELCDGMEQQVACIGVLQWSKHSIRFFGVQGLGF